jgi:hypothetical protein
MFTKRHYQALADTIRQTRICEPDHAEALDHLLWHLCDSLEEDSRDFDRATFLHESGFVPHNLAATNGTFVARFAFRGEREYRG